MEFSKENVEQSWTILNSKSTPDMLKAANDYLMSFKV